MSGGRLANARLPSPPLPHTRTPALALSLSLALFLFLFLSLLLTHTFQHLPTPPPPPCPSSPLQVIVACGVGTVSGIYIFTPIIDNLKEQTRLGREKQALEQWNKQPALPLGAPTQADPSDGALGAATAPASPAAPPADAYAAAAADSPAGGRWAARVDKAFNVVPAAASTTDVADANQILKDKRNAPAPSA
jgi:hypothetical protein